MGERSDHARKLPNLDVAAVRPLTRVCEGGHVIGCLEFKPFCDMPLRVKGICSVRDHQPTSHKIKPRPA
jgi:hypothetical protein